VIRQPGSYELQLERKGIWLSALLAIVLIAGGLWWILHAKHLNIPPVTIIPNLPPSIEFRLNHVTLHAISNGKIVWEIDADHFDLTKDQRSFVVGGLQKMALVKDGKEELTVNADGLEQNIITGDISIYGHVSVMGTNLTFRTPGASWSDRTQTLFLPEQFAGQFGDITVVAEKGARYQVNGSLLHCEGNVTVGYNGNIVRAAGLELNAVLNQLTVKGPVHARLVVDDIQQWSEGLNVPKVPEIPQSVKDAYRNHCIEKGYRY